MRYTAIFTTFALLALLAGCGAYQETVTGVKSEDAAALNSQHAKFENASDPEFTPATWFAAGQLAETQNAWANAIEAYEHAVKLDPAHLPSLYRLGFIHTQLKQYKLAIADWQRYIQASNDDATGYSNLGFCYELAARPDDAEKAYQQGLSKDPRNEACRVNYGLMLARTGRQNEALLQLQQALSPSQSWYNLGSVYEQQGKGQQAKSAYRKAMELDPTSPARSRLATLE